MGGGGEQLRRSFWLGKLLHCTQKSCPLQELRFWGKTTAFCGVGDPQQWVHAHIRGPGDSRHWAS